MVRFLLALLASYVSLSGQIPSIPGYSPVRLPNVVPLKVLVVGGQVVEEDVPVIVYLPEEGALPFGGTQAAVPIPSLPSDCGGYRLVVLPSTIPVFQSLRSGRVGTVEIPLFAYSRVEDYADRALLIKTLSGCASGDAHGRTTDSLLAVPRMGNGKSLPRSKGDLPVIVTKAPIGHMDLADPVETAKGVSSSTCGAEDRSVLERAIGAKGTLEPNGAVGPSSDGTVVAQKASNAPAKGGLGGVPKIAMPSVPVRAPETDIAEAVPSSAKVDGGRLERVSLNSSVAPAKDTSIPIDTPASPSVIPQNPPPAVKPSEKTAKEPACASSVVCEKTQVTPKRVFEASSDGIIELAPHILQPLATDDPNPFLLRSVPQSSVRTVTVELTGTVLGSKPCAVVNGRIVAVGDDINGLKVYAVERDSLILSRVCSGDNGDETLLMRVPLAREKPVVVKFPE